jgi:hypothetical protein
MMELPDFKEGELVEVLGIDDSFNPSVEFIGIFEGWHDLGLDEFNVPKLARVLDTELGRSFYYSPKMLRRVGVQAR